jgi:hypothetical protein
MGPSKSWYVAALVRLGSLNCCENIDTNLIGKLLVVRTGDHGHSFQFHRAVASRLMHSWAVRCHGIRAQSMGAYLSMPSSPRSIMSTAPTAPSTSTSQSNFASIFNASFESYKRKTKNDLSSHPLLPSLQSCQSPEAVLTVLRDQVPANNQSQSSDDRLTKWVAPTVNVLYSFTGSIGQGVGLVNIKKFRGEFLP